MRASCPSIWESNPYPSLLTEPTGLRLRSYPCMHMLKLSLETTGTHQSESSSSHTEVLARAMQSPLLQFSSRDQHYPLHFGAWRLAKVRSQVRLLAEAGAAVHAALAGCTQQKLRRTLKEQTVSAPKRSSPRSEPVRGSSAPGPR